jgi:hydrophobic/amphiphilic exporter-1 (mainly G- bacteria), HAE1 family
MDFLARLSVKRPIFASVLMLALVVLGTVSYSSLGLDYFPNIDIPIVVVTTRQPGSAAQEIESDITDKIEGAVNTISGIDELRSTSSEGISQVVVTFTLDKPVDVAVQEVRDKVSQTMPDLPRGIDAPVVTKLDPGASPVLYVALRSKQPIRETTELADKVVRRQIETIDGVCQVSLVGGRKRQINVLLDPIALQAQGLTAVDVRVLATQNLNVPGGNIETGPKNLTLRVAGRVATVEEIGRLVLREQGGHAVRIDDIGHVEDGQENEESFAQFDNEPTVVLDIKKQSGKNTVAVVDAVLARLSEIRQGLPPNVTLEVVYDNSGVIRTSTHAVIEHLILGAGLAAIVVLLFLGNVRSTFIAALAIPISIIGTFGAMYVLGFTLNFLTLLALALAVGLVIDDAIVVIENVVRHIEKRGMKPFPAAVVGTRDISLAVLATTLALMAVFIPVSFMGGIVGRFLRSFGLTMAAAIFVSLLVSFTLTPMLASRLLKAHDPDAPPPLLTRVVDRLYRPVESGYLVILRAAMRRRWVVILMAVGALLSIGPIGKRLTGGFLPANDKAQFQVSVRAPEGTSVAETRFVAERAAQRLAEMPGVTHTLITIGDDEQETQNLANIRVLLAEPNERALSQLELMDRARRDVVAKLPKTLRVTVADVPDFGGGGQSAANIAYAVSGPDLGELSRLATQITEELRVIPGAVDVDNSLIVGKPEVRMSVDRDRAADLGVEASDVADTLRLFVGGLKLSTFADNGQQYDIRARADERFRDDPAALGLVTVPSRKHGSVPLMCVVRAEESTGPSTVERYGRTRQITITANSAPGVGDSKIETAL